MSKDSSRDIIFYLQTLSSVRPKYIHSKITRGWWLGVEGAQMWLELTYGEGGCTAFSFIFFSLSGRCIIFSNDHFFRISLEQILRLDSVLNLLFLPDIRCTAIHHFAVSLVFMCTDVCVYAFVSRCVYLSACKYMCIYMSMRVNVSFFISTRVNI